MATWVIWLITTTKRRGREDGGPDERAPVAVHQIYLRGGTGEWCETN
jgi:hypothetical protein